MSNEATIRASLAIRKGALNYQSRPDAFYAAVDGGPKGPLPGNVVAVETGTNVDLSGVANPGLCRIANLDASAYVTYGIWDPEDSKFLPLGEVLAGEFYVLRLSRQIQWESGVGAGTTGDPTNRLQLRSSAGSVNVLVEVFER